jgi:mono/diheme cytochrome c family protein
MKTIYSTFMAALFLAGVSGVARADGAEMFGKKCAGCHGKDGKSLTTMGKKLNIRDLTDPKVQAGSTDEQWEKIVVNGVKGAGGKNVMPATKATPEEVKDLVKFTRSLKKK